MMFITELEGEAGHRGGVNGEEGGGSEVPASEQVRFPGCSYPSLPVDTCPIILCFPHGTGHRPAETTVMTSLLCLLLPLVTAFSPHSAPSACS